MGRAAASRWSLLHLITRLELGGAQLMALHEIAHSRFPSGARVLAFGPGGLLDARAAALDNVAVVPLPALGREISPGRDLVAILAVARLVRRIKAREPGRLLVHTHSSKAGIVGRLGAFLGGADCIVHSIHGFGHSHAPTPRARRILLAAERLASRVTDGFTAASEANLREGERDGILRGQPRCVVRCGIDLTAFGVAKRSRAAVRAELVIAPEAPVVITVANFKPQKDPLCWAAVVRYVTARHPDAIFVYAGDGELRQAVEAELAAHGLSASVRLLGWRHDIAELLHASDVFLLTSRFEGLPQSLPQAMAAHLPIVATDVDGTAEAISEGDNGLLCRARDSVGLAAAVTRLLADASLRQRMAARSEVRLAEFSLERMVADLVAFYALLTRV